MNQRWVMNKVNLKRWCSQGIATTHRSELRDVLYELLLFSGKTDSDAQEMIETIEHVKELRDVQFQKYTIL